MSIPTAENDNAAAIIKRIEIANNRYTFSYSENALKSVLNMGGYSARPHKDFDGELYWSISKKNYKKD